VSCVSVNYSIFQHELDLRGVHKYDILVILLFCSFLLVDVPGMKYPLLINLGRVNWDKLHF